MPLVVEVTLRMNNYIAHPFWPERNACIDIEKKSGVNRQKSDEKRVAALKAECGKQGITYDRYLELRPLAARQWSRRKDERIYIPRHQVAGGLVQTIGTAPKALRGMFDKDNFRALIQIGDFETALTEPTGIFGRFVKLDGSNQRSWQENEYLGHYLDEGEPFTATGVVSIDDPKQLHTVKSLFTETIERIGIGAARKMGFGRGVVTTFETKE
jgi:hypothetical protein